MEEHFDAGGAQGIDAIVDWKIFDRPDGGYDHWRIEIADAACRVHDEPDERPARVTFRIKPVDFLKLVTGNASGPQMFITGSSRSRATSCSPRASKDSSKIPTAGRALR